MSLPRPSRSPFPTALPDRPSRSPFPIVSPDPCDRPNSKA
ncbi:hypothetical protein KCH_69450 [Kitasatospora cheerisanensis KCTC 2395]|uniref:Uncharacterized protein n=1 Tax=Kitasatospora cheerisanensis KCTC 2395 TaxID=1348663 RepID=A0A066YIK6_9ACTN|nr:hypothetical protein KCH_69450 [Kitasatospora cheerisanensis KCTC 2395]